MSRSFWLSCPSVESACLQEEVRFRFGVLVREVANAADGGIASLVCDSYRDVLLDEAFATFLADSNHSID